MKKHAALLSVILLYTLNPVFSQEPLSPSFQYSCSYYGDSLPDGPIYTFASTKEASDIVKRITDAVGLEPNFVLMAAPVENACAGIDSATGQRVILYNQSFISSIETASGTDWSGISILAHEIGHHLNGHTVNRLDRTVEQKHLDELQADKFSGFACYKLGATLVQAQSAMNIVGTDEATDSHPAKRDRLNAIAVGWSNAKDGSVLSPPKSEPPVITPSNSKDSVISVLATEIKPECEKNNTGEYIFTNQTSKTMNVRIYSKTDINKRNPVRELTITAGESGTLYDLTVDSYFCIIEEDAYRSDHGIPGNLPYGYHPYKSECEIKLEQCKTKTFTIR